MNFVNDARIGKLRCSFPKLTETNQIYVLGFAEGLKQAQEEANRTVSAKDAGDRDERGSRRCII